MSEKYLRSFDNAWQAEAFGQELEKIGIRYRIAPRAREYTTVLLGGSQDVVDMFVNEHRHALALQTLAEMLEAGTPLPASSQEPNRDYFKRIIFLSVLGVCLMPLVFNWAATSNYLLFRKQNPSSKRHAIAVSVLIISWISAIGELGLLLSTLKVI